MQSIKTAVLIILILSFSEKVSGQEKDRVINEEMDGYIYKPQLQEPTDERVSKLKVPDGFKVNKFAEGLGEPRIIVATEDGIIYVSRKSKEDVLMLKDTDNDGRADDTLSVIQQEQAHGLAINNGQLYLVTVNEIFRGDILKDGRIGQIKKIVEGLPDGGQHANRTIAFGPDGRLYISVGSTCNACKETDEESATMLIANADGSDRRIFAEGLRNTIGFDWHPETGDLWAMDHGIDWFGQDEQKEELNLLEEGKNYGWPYIYEDGKFNLSDKPEEKSWEEYAETSEGPKLMHTAHSAPMGLLFYRGNMFPEEYRDKAFVTFHGSWNTKPAVGYYLQVLDFEDGEPKEFREFVTGFLADDNRSIFGRPVGMAELKDGSLLFTDDSNGVIYRVSYGE